MTFTILKLLWIGKSFRVEILFTLSHQLLQPKKFNLRDRWLFQHSRGGGWMAFGCSTASWLLSFCNWLKIATMIMTMNNWPWLCPWPWTIDHDHDHEQLTMTGVPCGNSSPLLFTPAQLIRGSEASSHFDSSLCLARCAHWHGKDINMCQIYSSPRTTL